MPQQLLYFIYGLIDPRLNGPLAVRYIGITTTPNLRYDTHLRCLSTDPEDKNAWVQDVLASGLEPDIEIFEVYKAPASKEGRKQALERETYWIRHYQALGANLLNYQKRENHIKAEFSMTEDEFWNMTDEDFLRYFGDMPGTRALVEWSNSDSGTLLGGEPEW